MNSKYILGLDGGGTYTRVAVTDINGNLRSYIEWKGATSIKKDKNAKENVFNAIHEAVKKADCGLGDIIGLTAGVGGYDSENDLEWVRGLTDIDGLACPVQSVNDAVVAQKGAFLLEPGIIAISGTGSIIFGITEANEHIRNYDFHHYAATAARFLSYDSVYKMIAGETDQTDGDFVNTVLKHFKVTDLTALAKLGAKGFVEENTQRMKLFGDLAPAVTDAALSGSRLAEQICGKAAADLVTGVKLVGACFESDSVSVALIGSVANSIFIKNKITESLNKMDNNKNYRLVAEPALPPVLGAVIMTMQSHQISLDGQILLNLQKGAELIYKHTASCE